jgi:K+-sensing histidine kinase KdpD
MIINPITFLIGLVFAPVAAMMAFLITYGEYQHHYPDKATPLKLALEAAVVTFIFFLALSIITGWLLGKIIG